ncbi:SRPBCC family protein [Streptomyces sp. NPDC050658]|uniref:SRPBCC family protein n=1 Tax=unclassified Streptomyces TaxID=2593676 RepID=UPI0034450202
MALFTITRQSPLPAPEAWHRLTAWERHGSVVPLTRVTVRTPPPTGEGTVFVARSGIGRLGFDDIMEVVVWRPPGPDGAGGLCRLEKRGTFVTGWAEIGVTPAPARRGCLITWREELRVRGLPTAFDRPLSAAGRLMFGRAMRGLLNP